MYNSIRLQIGAALVLASLCTVVRAADIDTKAAANPLYLTVYTDVAGGSKLVAGEYDAAITEYQQVSRRAAPKSLRLTNLCVAQTITQAWLAARETCNAAVEAARLDRLRAPAWPNGQRERYRDFLAVAYSNRAVLSILVQDMPAGDADLKFAHSLAPRAHFVKRNLEATRATQAARVVVRTVAN
jgi:hypothetical protein